MKTFRFEIEPISYVSLLSSRFKELTREGKLQWHSTYEDLANEIIFLTGEKDYRSIKVVKANSVLEASKQIDLTKYKIVSIITL